MSLLAPLLLAGLALLIVPVLVHLTQRQRKDVTAFPSLMFLREIPFRSTNRRRIRHPLLFALRCLALILLVLAFARPWFAGGAAVGDDQGRDVVLLLDTSGSLAYAGRRDAAIEAARTALAELGEGDRAALVTFDDRAEQRVALTPDVEALRSGLAGVRPTDRPTRLETGLLLAGRILGDSDRARREVVLVSDFQRTAWEEGRARLPVGVTLRPILVGDGRSANVAIGDVQLTAAGENRHRILARIVNLGAEAVGDLAVSLELGGREIATRTVALEPRGAAAVAFDDVALPAGEPRGRVRVAADGLATDDELRFLATANPVLDVVLLEGGRGRSDRSLFLERALGLGVHPRVEVARRSLARFDFATLPRTAAVILNDTDPGSADRAAALRAWVERGGALFVVLGPGSEPARWAGADTLLLGGTVGTIVDRAARSGSRLAWLDYDHPVFEPFSTPRSGDFSGARFFRFRAFEPDSSARVLARFEEGEPALVEHTLGEGRVLTWTSTLDRFWNDLALQPVFLPFAHRALRHAAAYEEPRRWIETGDELELARLVGEEPAEWVLVTPGDERRPLEGSDSTTWIEFPEAGFYRLETLDGDRTPITVAVNLPLAESDLAAVAPELVAAAAGSASGDGAGTDAVDATARAGASTAVEAGRSELWWPLLLLAALVLAAESFVANRWSRRRGPERAVRVGPEKGKIG